MSIAVSSEPLVLRQVQPVPGPGGRVIAGPWVACPAPLRLTRRGRLVLTLTVVLGLLAAVLAGVLLLSPLALAGAAPRPGAGSVSAVVLPGETLWQIAGRVAPEADRRETVTRIKQLNGLDGATLQAGRRILLPAP